MAHPTHVAAHEAPGPQDLLRLPLDELQARARAVRDEPDRHPDHLLAQGVHPAHDAVPRQVRLLHLRPAAGPAGVAVPHARAGARHRPAAARRPAATRRCSPSASAPRSATRRRPSGSPATGTTSTVDYLAAMCRLVLDETGLLPHANAGALHPDELAAAPGRRPAPGDDDRDAARRPRVPPRLARQDAGPPPGHARGGRRARPSRSPPGSSSASARTQSTGSTRSRRSPSRHARHGHVQEVIVQNFLPKPGTGMHKAPPCPPDDFLQAIALARLILPPEIHLQAPPNLSDDFGVLLDAGIDDWGGVSPVTADHVNPERPWPALDRLREVTEARGLRPRPPPHRLPRVRAATRAAGSTRRCASRCSTAATPRAWAATTTGTRATRTRRRTLVPGPRRRPGGAVGEVLAGALLGQELGVDEIVTLFGARGPEVAAVAEVADDLRREAVGDVVTYVQNRNINYTNVCTFKCRFCGFSKGPLSLNLRGTPYLLTLDDIAGRVREAWDLGATEVCLQGGIHPDFDGDYYIDVTRAVKEAAPDIHVHGFTALEVTEGAKRLGEPLADYLRRLMDAGLATLPGHRGRDPRRRDPRRAVPRQDRHRGVARRPPHRPRGRPALQRHHHVRRDREPGALGPPPRAHPRPAEGDGRVHRVRAAAVRAHGRADLPAAQGPPGPDLPRGAADARRRAHRLPRRHRQHPGVLGEDGPLAASPRCCRPGSTTSAAP